MGKSQCYDANDLKCGTCDFFTDFFTKKKGDLFDYNVRNCFPELSEADIRLLDRPVVEEVKDALF